MLYVEIIYNLSLLVALSVLSSFIGQKRSWSTTTKSLLQGIVFGSIAIIGMLYPLTLSPGVIFDGRSVVISLCGLFFGPFAALLAAVMAITARVWIGGVGILTGSLVISASALLGILFYYRIIRRKSTVSNRALLLLGMSVHVVMLLLMFTFPYSVAMQVIRNVGLTILTIYPLATIIIGRIIYDNLEKATYTAQLAASEEKYRRIAENMSDVIWTTDLRGRPTFVSPSVESLLGKPVELFVRQGIDEQFPPDSAVRLRAAIAEELSLETDPRADTKRSRYTELEIYRADGSTIWISLSATILRDGEGRAMGFQGVMRDISARRRAESELRAAKEKAEESDRLKTAFLMNMSHEIRTPMNGILGFLSLLAEPDLEEESKQEYIEIMNISGLRLLTTINDIIEISRIETGEIELIHERIDVNELLGQQFEFFLPQAAAKGLDLRIAQSVEPESAMLRTDRHKLEGILGNLINNAIKFTDTGGIEFGNYIEDGWMEFFVKDSGCGIPNDRLDAVFERFVQAETKMARKHEGSGLGLPIVKAYVTALGGSIRVTSHVGSGSTFSFALPISEDVEIPNTVSEHAKHSA